MPHQHPTPVLNGQLAPAMPPERPARRKAPYTVERFPSVQGSILLVGYDGRGEVMVELRLPEAKVTPRTAARMRRWLIENDDAPPPLALVP